MKILNATNLRLITGGIITGGTKPWDYHFESTGDELVNQEFISHESSKNAQSKPIGVSGAEAD